MLQASAYQKSISLLKRPGLRTAGIYTFSNFFGKGLSFLLIPIFTNPKFLTPADNGLLSLFGQAVVLLVTFVNLGVLQSFSVDYFKMQKADFSDLCTTGLCMAFGMACFSGLVFFLFRGVLYRTFSFPPLFIWAIPLLAFLTFLYEMIIIIIRNREDAKSYLKLNLFKIITELGLALLLIVVFSFGWLGRVSGMLIALTGIAIFGLYFLKQNGYLFGRLRSDLILSELKFSIPVIFMQFSIFCLFSSDSFFLSGLSRNNALVGIYGLACVFGSVIITFSSALIQYIVPKINKELSRPVINYKPIRRNFLMYIKLMAGLYLLMLVAVPFLYRWFINPLYFGGIKYYYLISTGYFFWTISTFLYRFPLFFKLKKSLFYLGLVSIFISLAGNYFFIFYLDAIGAAISVCTSYFLVLAGAVFVTRKYLKQMFCITSKTGLQ